MCFKIKNNLIILIFIYTFHLPLQASQEEYQVPGSSLAPPPLPPKQTSMSSPCLSPKPNVYPLIRDRLPKDHNNLVSPFLQTVKYNVVVPVAMYLFYF